MAPFIKFHTHMFLMLAKNPLEMSALCNTFQISCLYIYMPF
jgi:hypothetical protein